MEVIVPVVALGLGVALSPVAVIAVILLLVSPDGHRKAAAFLAGWIGGLALVAVVVVVLERLVGVGGERGPGWIAPLVSLVLGVLLLAFAVRRLLRRPTPGDDDPKAGWLAALDKASAGRALGTGAILAVAKPKNLVLTLAAATTLAEAAVSAASSAAALVVYLVVGSVSVAAPLVVALSLGERSAVVLAGWKSWLTANDATLMTAVLVVFGALLVYKGVTGLV